MRSDLPFERRDLPRPLVEDADEHEVAALRHPVDPLEAGERVHPEGRDGIGPFDAISVQISRTIPAERHGPARRTHHHEADTGMRDEPIDEAGVALLDHLL